MRPKRVIWLCLLLVLVGLGACTFVQRESDDDAPGVVGSRATEVAAAPVLTLAATAIPTVTAALTALSTVTTSLTNTVVPTATTIITVTPMVSATVPAEPEATSTLTNSATTTPTSMPSPTMAPSDTPTPTAAPTPTKEPTSTPTEGPPPTPTSPPQTVFVTNHRSYTEGPDLYVVGEVVNGSAYPAFGVRVIATFFDAGDRMLAAQESFAFLNETAPTQANPFKIQLSNSPANVNRYDLNLSWDDISVVDYDRVTVTREDADDEEGVAVLGELRNDHPSAIKNIRVIATFYDSAGQIVNAYPGTVDVSALDPGATTGFAIRTGDPNLEFESVLVQTQGILVR